MYPTTSSSSFCSFLTPTTTNHPKMTRTNPTAIVFTDWDGTVTLQDSNDLLTDELGMGHPRRQILNDKILSGEMSFSEGFSLMLESVSSKGISFQYCIDYLLKHIKLDPGFRKFYEYCYANKIPLYVISSGMEPIIDALLRKLVGEDSMEYIKIISNGVAVDGDSWHIVYRDSTPFGHDKNASIHEILNESYDMKSEQDKPVLFYCGDGVSDISAAGSCDLLFAKRGKDLVTVCRDQHIAFKQFDDFSEILKDVTDVVNGDVQLESLFEK